MKKVQDTGRCTEKTGISESGKTGTVVPVSEENKILARWLSDVSECQEFNHCAMSGSVFPHLTAFYFQTRGARCVGCR